MVLHNGSYHCTAGLLFNWFGFYHKSKSVDNFNVRKLLRAGVVAQLVERSLPTPEVHSSNPVIGKNLY